jgi:cytochrome c5
MLKPFLLFSAMALVVTALFVSPAGAPAQAGAAGSKSAAKPAAGADSTAKAKKIYAMDCALCHGDIGDGKTDLAKDMQLTLIDWTDPKSLSDKKDEELFNIIRNGKGKMPPEETGRAKDDEVKGLIIYIRTFSKDHPAAPTTAPATPAPPAPAAPTGATATPGNQ